MASAFLLQAPHLPCLTATSTKWPSLPSPSFMQYHPLRFHSSPLRGFPAFQTSSGVGGGSRRGLLVEARGGGGSVPPTDRALAAVGYLLPLLDGMQYGNYFFMQYPAAETLVRPLFPLLYAYRSVPFASFVAFFGLYLLIVRNPSLSRYVRYNCMQAVVLDVILILPSLAERILSPTSGIAFDLLVIFYNTVFLFIVACFAFAVVSCALGKTPRLPIVADAADAQVM